MLRASERGQRRARSRSGRGLRAAARAGQETQARVLGGLGSHDIHRGETAGGDGCGLVARRR